MVGRGERPVKVGVRLARPTADLGEWLAESAALDAAGADALWLDAAFHDPVDEGTDPRDEGTDPRDEGTDPLVLTAALAAVTSHALLVAGLPAGAAASDGRVASLATIDRLSRGRLALVGQTAPLADLRLFHEVGGGFECPVAGGEPERWEPTELPAGRAAWQAALAGAAERGVSGLLVPAGRGILDLLRNPQGRRDRRDLQLAQG